MTFAKLIAKVGLYTDQDIKYNGVINEFLRQGENDFIEKTLCTEKLLSVDTSTSSDIDSDKALYTLPADFLRELRITWNGEELEKALRDIDNFIYQSDGETLLEGRPYQYWHEAEKLRLIPAASSDGIMNIWYVYLNTDDDSASPAIPLEFQNRFIYYAIASMWEYLGDEQKASYYWNRYEKDIAYVRDLIDERRYSNGTIIDVNGGGGTRVQSYNVAVDSRYSEATFSE